MVAPWSSSCRIQETMTTAVRINPCRRELQLPTRPKPMVRRGSPAGAGSYSRSIGPKPKVRRGSPAGAGSYKWNHLRPWAAKIAGRGRLLHETDRHDPGS